MTATERQDVANPLRGSGSGVEIFEAHYAGAPGAGWEINRPQPAFAKLAREGAFHGRVLDVGCGSGENALLTASLGLDTTGVDAAPTAIAIADRKARERGLAVRFLEWDALNLDGLGETFDTVLDCGLFHCFTSEDRPALAASLGAVLAPGGRYFMMCFSDRQPGEWGPQRVSQAAIESTFTAGWRIDSIEPATIDTTFEPGFALAWLAVITRC